MTSKKRNTKSKGKGRSKGSKAARAKGPSEYTFVEREEQVIKRRNHAPLGRPPTDPLAKKKYKKAKGRKY